MIREENMALTIRDVSDLTRLLVRYPEWRAEMRRIVLSDELLAMPETMREIAAAQARTDARLESLTERMDALTVRMDQLTERMDALTVRMDQLTERMAELAAAQARTEQRVDRLTEEMREVRMDLGKLKGRALEREYADRAPALFGGWLRRIRVVLPGTLGADFEDHLAARLTVEELRDVLRLDVLLRGRLAQGAENQEVYLALEVSSVIDRGDLERAQRRAGLLRRTGLAAMPVVAGEELTEGVERLLAEAPVIVMTDGHSRGWERALAVM
jgi:hypothetical protein